MAATAADLKLYLDLLLNLKAKLETSLEVSRYVSCFYCSPILKMTRSRGHLSGTKVSDTGSS